MVWPFCTWKLQTEGRVVSFVVIWNSFFRDCHEGANAIYLSAAEVTLLQDSQEKTPIPCLAASSAKFSGFLQLFLEQEEKLEMFLEPFPAWEAIACQGKHKSQLKGLQAGKNRETTWYLEIDMILIIIRNRFPEEKISTACICHHME